MRVPDGCLLLQAGRQMAYLTGGRVLAGFHEVIAVPEATPGIIAARTRGLRPVRVSSTVFAHVASDRHLYPRGPFATRRAIRNYPRVTAGHMATLELKAIALKQ